MISFYAIWCIIGFLCYAAGSIVSSMASNNLSTSLIIGVMIFVSIFIVLVWIDKKR